MLLTVNCVDPETLEPLFPTVAGLKVAVIVVVPAATRLAVPGTPGEVAIVATDVLEEAQVLTLPTFSWEPGVL